MNATLRKLRKLFKSPRQYFIDSKINKLLNPPKKQIMEKASSQNLEPIFSLSTDSIFISHKINSTIKKDNCLFLLVNKASQDLLEKIGGSQDVVQLRTDHLIPMHINRKSSEIEEWKEAEIIKKLTQKDINYLSEFKFIISVNPTDNIAKLIRSCNWNSILLSVITKNGNMSFCDKDNVDALICPKKYESQITDFKYVKTFDENDPKDLVEKIKESLRELCSRNPDYFVPIKRSTNIILNNIDRYRDYDAIVKISNNCFKESAPINFDESLKLVEIDHILIRESLFFRYKNIIKKCQAQDKYLQLISRMAKDGVHFYYD